MMMMMVVGKQVRRVEVNWRIWAALAVLPLAFSTVARAGQGPSEAYRYLEQVGDLRHQVHWCVVKAPVTRLIYRSAAEVAVTETDAALATKRWQMQTSGRATTVNAVRKGNALVIDGVLNGSKIHKHLTIDAAPWYQTLSWSLRRLVASAQPRIEFWILRTDTLSAHKVVAEKRAPEEIKAAGQTYRAQVVELHLSGLLAPFWKCRYWFRAEDGVFLRFKGPSGPPGAPDMVVSYEGPAGPCATQEEIGSLR
jgi:hypothetical protein